MIAVPGHESIGLFQDLPELAEICLEVAGKFIGEGIVDTNYGDVQVSRIVRIDVLKYVFCLDVESDDAHKGHCTCSDNVGQGNLVSIDILSSDHFRNLLLTPGNFLATR